MGKTIIFTGGGTTGHVAVNLALIPKFTASGWNVSYIGSESGIESRLIADLDDVRYYGIATGKLRRYFDWNNVKDPFKVIKGMYQAYRIIRRLKPRLIFSKGGFVSVPVVLAGWMNRVPVVIHESDITPGLANRIAIPFASKVCTTFPETQNHLPSSKAEYVGAVVREELMHGNAAQGLNYCSFVRGKPVLLIMGGSQGSQRLNAAVRASLNTLLNQFQIVHICGKDQTDPSLERRGYKQFEYIQRELPDILAMTSLVISRAGSNSIFEFLALRIPMLLIPLSKQASRGDQILNARSFAASGFCEVLQEEQLTDDKVLVNAVIQLHESRDSYIARMNQSGAENTLEKLMGIIHEASQ